MRRLSRFAGILCLGAALTAPLIGTGCYGSVRYYDADYGDYHTWGPGEDVYYRQWLGERHYEYRDFHKWDRSHQSDYWKWRHAHGDRH
jgi:hypothetical protein